MFYLAPLSSPATATHRDTSNAYFRAYVVRPGCTFELPGQVVESLDRLVQLAPPIDFAIRASRPVPAEVAAWRIKAVAKLRGLDTAIAAALAALPEPTRTVATAAWNEGNVIRRDSATVQQLAPALNLTSAQIDELFRQADAIQV